MSCPVYGRLSDVFLRIEVGIGMLGIGAFVGLWAICIAVSDCLVINI
jgi:hypothetical protein